MFRYVGLAWDPSQPKLVLESNRLAAGLVRARGWSTVLVRPGLQVFATGVKPRINGAYELQGSQGVVLGRLFRRAELETSESADITLARQESEVIRESGGRSLVLDFWGRYVAFISTASGHHSVLRDPSGALPCFHLKHQGVTIVFSWLDDVLALLTPDALPHVNWDALQAHILYGGLGWHETALAGVSEVLAGERFELESGTSTLLWSGIDIASSPSQTSSASAAAKLRDVVHACTRAWASCHDTILLRLSGGVDSSILASCLSADRTETDVLCVNYHSEGSDSDERLYARLAASRAGRDLIERERDANFRIDRVLTVARMPAPVAYAGWMNATTDARLAAAHRASAMFTGAGGDPLFFQFASWWPAADYLKVRGLDRGFPAAAMDAAHLSKSSVWHVARRAFGEWLRPDRRIRTTDVRAHVLLTPQALSPSWPQRRFAHTELLRSTLPIGKHMQAAHLLHPIGYYDPLERDAAPEIVNPLLSQPLVELCLRLPSYVLTEGGQGRALARRAFSADLHPEIATRRSKGGMEEHVKAILMANLPFARSMLLDGELARRGLVDRDKVEQLLSNTPTAIAAHMGHVHSLIGVEAWLTRWPR
jgi:asparagine synthase (glutamine-hydrolysing)